MALDDVRPHAVFTLNKRSRVFSQLCVLISLHKKMRAFWAQHLRDWRQQYLSTTFQPRFKISTDSFWSNRRAVVGFATAWQSREDSEFLSRRKDNYIFGKYVDATFFFFKWKKKNLLRNSGGILTLFCLLGWAISCHLNTLCITNQQLCLPGVTVCLKGLVLLWNNCKSVNKKRSIRSKVAEYERKQTFFFTLYNLSSSTRWRK